MKKFKKKHLKKLNGWKQKLHNTSFFSLSVTKPNYVKNQFRDKLFVIRQLKKKLGVSSFSFFNKLKNQNSKHFVLDNLLKIYFKRLDLLLVFIGFYNSLYNARQNILHKKVYVNNKKVTSSNYLLKKGDIITISGSKNVSSLSTTNYSCEFCEINYKILTCIILSSSLKQSDIMFFLKHFNWTSLKNRKFFF
jgi:ribosomal protein S4